MLPIRLKIMDLQNVSISVVKKTDNIEFRPQCHIGGWGVSPTGKSYSFRSCVRASEAACGRGTMLLPRLGCGSSQRAPTFRGVPFPSPSQNHSLVLCWPANRCKSLLIDCKSFPVASRCFSLLPAAFPLLLAAFRLHNCKSMRLDPRLRFVPRVVLLS